eukprot:5741618-Heterocapsa_arctica.AAC.1
METGRSYTLRCSGSGDKVAIRHHSVNSNPGNRLGNPMSFNMMGVGLSWVGGEYIVWGCMPPAPRTSSSDPSA